MAKGKGYKINPKTGKQIRGFASISPERQREIASMGGKVSRGGRKPQER